MTTESKITPPPLEPQLISAIDENPNYQLLRRLEPKSAFNQTNNIEKHLACIIDTETTGLNTEQCEIIELGYQVVEFDSQGNFYQVLTAKNFLNEPEHEPITAEITKVTGITPKEVIGHRIPWDEVLQDLQNVKLFIAHNAGFDRPILERYQSIFADHVWGCSVSQIDWFDLADVGSKSQEFLAWKIGQFFYDAHRALDDVQALTELLSQPLQDKPALAYLLVAVREQKVNVKAFGAPFEVKDQLRSRGYRWNASEKVWSKIINKRFQEEELAWLTDHQTRNPEVIKLKANDTFSIRAK